MDQVPTSQGIEPSSALEPISRTLEEKKERMQDCLKQQRKLGKYKEVLERWERDFIKRAGRRPEKIDLVDRPKMAERFQLYRRLKHQLFKDFPEELRILHPKLFEEPDSSKDKPPEEPPEEPPKIPSPKPIPTRDPDIDPVNFEIPESDDESLKHGVEEGMTYFPGTPPEITKCPEYTSDNPPYTLSPASLAFQRGRLEMAFQMEACLDINESIYPVYDPPRFVAEDEEVSSEEELGPMDMPPPRNFKKLYTRTPLFWKEFVNSYKVPPTDPLYMNVGIRRRGYVDRKFVNDSLEAGFNDLLSSRTKILRLTSSPYDRRHTPFSFPKLSQRVRGNKTNRELKKDLDRPFFPMMPGFHTRACSTRKRKYESITACEAENSSLPSKKYHDWEDDLFPVTPESQAKLFPNQLEDPRYIERERQRQEYLLEQEKANAPLVSRPLPVRRQRKLKNKDLVSTNFVRADMRRGKMRTGRSTTGTKARVRKSRYAR